MTEFLGSLWWLVVSLGILVTFHEFGHYWVARRCGVRVLRFSVGFGGALWSRFAKDGTEYRIAAIPLGGYVKMLDEREADVPPGQAHLAFNRQPVWKRIAIVAAGPVANLVLCLGLLWAMFVVGRPDYAAVVGRADGIAAEAGLRPGDEVLAADGRATPTWTELHMALLAPALDRRDVPLRVRGRDGGERDVVLPLSRLPEGFDQRQFASAIGLLPRHLRLPALVGRVEPDSAAWGLLAEGDLITAIDGRPVDGFDAIAPLVQEVGGNGGTAMVEVLRDGERLALEVTPRLIPAPTATASTGRSASPRRATSNCRRRTPSRSTVPSTRSRPRSGRWGTSPASWRAWSGARSPARSRSRTPCQDRSRSRARPTSTPGRDWHGTCPCWPCCR